MLTRNSDTNDGLQASVSNTVASALSVTNRVVFVPGQASAMFEVFALADDTPDPDQITRLEIAAPGHRSVFAAIVVRNIDEPSLRLTVGSPSVREGLSAAVTLRRTGNADLPARVSIESSNPQRLAAPNQIDFAAGQSQVTFAAIAPDKIGRAHV